MENLTALLKSESDLSIKQKLIDAYFTGKADGIYSLSKEYSKIISKVNEPSVNTEVNMPFKSCILNYGGHD